MQCSDILSFSRSYHRTPITHTHHNSHQQLIAPDIHRAPVVHVSRVTCICAYVAHYVAAPPHSSQLTASSHPPTSRDSVLHIQKSAFY